MVCLDILHWLWEEEGGDSGTRPQYGNLLRSMLVEGVRGERRGKRLRDYRPQSCV